MLSLDFCKKHLKNKNYTDKQIEEFRNSLYQLAEILVDNYIDNKKNKPLIHRKENEID